MTDQLPVTIIGITDQLDEIWIIFFLNDYGKFNIKERSGNSTEMYGKVWKFTEYMAVILVIDHSYSAILNFDVINQTYDVVILKYNKK